MNANFFEALLGLMEIVWMFFMTAVLFITIPVWVLPYTMFKIWQWVQE